MKKQSIQHPRWAFPALIIVLIVAGCSGNANTPTPAPTSIPAASPTALIAESTATPAPVADKNILYHDDFTNPASGWSENKLDDYFVGYHEPEYYHFEITSPNDHETIFGPDKQSFSDATVEIKVFTVSKKTAAEGDFRYGIAFRRVGDQYYAFTISPRTKKWYVLKSSPSALEVLAEGTEDSIHDLDAEDVLRVDAQGSNFSFHINDKLVDQVTDAAYAAGEIGFYVETFDATNVHIHYDDLTIRKVEVPQESALTILYQDDFTNPASGWSENKLNDYFVGYHEPEYYHFEITSPNDHETIFEPEKQSFSDATVEIKVFTVSKKTAAEGDFRYGIALRRSGDQYYAFTISPRTKKWYVLKSSPSALEVLAEGIEDSIHDLDAEDVLHVDALGSNFSFYINDHRVGQVTDSGYAAGEVGFYVETFDAPNVHIHFDQFTIRKFEVPAACTINAAVALNVRTGPSTKFPSSSFLTNGETAEPVGRSADATWIKIKLAKSDSQGWIYYSTEFVTCSMDVNTLPVISE